MGEVEKSVLEKEQNLREYLKQLEIILDNVPGLIFYKDTKNNYIRVNKVLAEAHNMTKEGLEGKNCFDLYPQDIAKAYWDDDLEVINSGEPKYNIEQPRDTTEGRRWLNTSKIPLKNSDGEIIGVLGFSTDITKRKQMEKSLRESEERLKSFLDSATDFFMLLDSKLNIVEVSQSGLKARGLKKEEMVDKNLLNLYPHIKETGRYDEYQEVMRTGKPFVIDDLIPHPKFGNLSVVLKTFKVGKGLGIITTDITKQKKMEQELNKYSEQLEVLLIQLHESKERLGAFMDSSTDAFSLWDTELNLIDSNKAAASMFSGKKKKDVLGKSMLDLLPNLKGTSRYDDYLKVIKTGKPFQTEDVALNPIFGNKYFNVRAFNVSSGLGIITSDITESKRVENELRIKNDAIASSINATYISDMDGNITYVNSSFLKMLKYDSESEILGKPLMNFLQMEDRVIEVIETLYDKGSWIGELVGKKKDHSSFDVEVSTNMVRDDSGKPICMMGSFIDISERKLAELAKKELEEKRANFISMTNHELKTPLTAIRGFIEILEDRIDELSLERRDKCIEIIKRNVYRLQRLIAGVADLGRIERSLFSLELKNIDIYDFIEKATQSYKSFLGNQLEVFHNKGQYSVFVEADSSRLNQVIDNILSNAIKHTSNDSRKIIVTSDVLPGIIRIECKDNGAGIRKEIQHKIFEQFVAFSSEYSAGGSGIGLYLSKIIVEKHGGTLTFHSEGEEKGTTFIVELPVKSGDFD
jgi:PAS domain S-box-containing protein